MRSQEKGAVLEVRAERCESRPFRPPEWGYRVPRALPWAEEWRPVGPGEGPPLVVGGFGRPSARRGLTNVFIKGSEIRGFNFGLEDN